VKYLQTSYHCPVCDVEVHKTKPLLHIRPDRTLQDIVFKLVPGLYQAELKLRHDFEEKQREENEAPEEKGSANEVEADKKEVEIEDPVCITLEYYRRKRNWLENQIFPTRYLRCPSALTVSVLKKFLVTKFAIPHTHQVEVIRCDEILDGHLTMRDVSRIYGLYAKVTMQVFKAAFTLRRRSLKTQLCFYGRLDLSSTLIRHENGAFRKRSSMSSNRRNSKTPAFRFRADGKHFENGAFRKRWLHDNPVISLAEFPSNTNSKTSVIVALLILPA